jgi:ribosomal protein S18 acetylase RimI-like enzyme
MPQIDFIKCSSAHISIIQQLADRIWRMHYPSIITVAQIDFMLHKMYSAESLAEQMINGHHFVILQMDEQPVGFISVSKKTEHHYFINKLYVDTTQHRKGLGKLLLDKVEADYRDAECFSLTVNRQNFKAINFYFKNGFVIDEVADFEIGNGFVMNDFVMKKELSLP